MAADIERIPPNSKEAERYVLGCMVRDNEVIGDVMLILRREDFYHDANQKVFRAIVALYEKGGLVDLVLLANCLKDHQQIEDIGGYGYLAELWDIAPTAAHVEYYARIVRDKAILRGLIHVGNRISCQAYSESVPPLEQQAEAELSVMRTADHLVAKPYPIAQVIGEVYDALDARCTQNRADGVPSGFRALDGLIASFRPGSLTTIAARPSAGKTAFACSLARQARCPVLFVSAEQSRIELVERFIVSAAKVNSHRVRCGWIGDDERQRIEAVGSVFRDLPIYIMDVPNPTLIHVAASARRGCRRDGVRMVIVDYLQLLRPRNRNLSRVEQVAEISSGLKQLARDIEVPVIVLAQLNREVEKRTNHKPVLADIRESGSIEQDSDLVLLLHREAMYRDRVAGEVERIDVIVAKHRNGPTGSVEVGFDPQSMRFFNLEDELECV